MLNCTQCQQFEPRGLASDAHNIYVAFSEKASVEIGYTAQPSVGKAASPRTAERRLLASCVKCMPSQKKWLLGLEQTGTPRDPQNLLLS